MYTLHQEGIFYFVPYKKCYVSAHFRYILTTIVLIRNKTAESCKVQIKKCLWQFNSVMGALWLWRTHLLYNVHICLPVALCPLMLVEDYLSTDSSESIHEPMKIGRAHV